MPPKNTRTIAKAAALTIGFGDTLNLVLLLDGVRVGRTTGGVDEFLGEAFCHCLQVAEGGLSCAGGQQVEGVVDPTEGGHIDGLTTNDTGTSDAGGVLTWTGVDDGIDDHLDGVLVRQEVDDFEGVLNDSAGHQLLSGVAALAHQTTRQALDDGARGLAESLLLVSASCVW